MLGQRELRAPELAEAYLPIERDTDIVGARQTGRRLALRLGLSAGEATVVATVISELARNVLLYAGYGEVVLRPIADRQSCGVMITVRDQGDGIADMGLAMQDGYSTSGRLGLGLPGVKRLTDEFTIVSEVGKGTTVTAKIWRRRRDQARRAET